eukprot:TRINITY_DN2355_c0_g1_i1.p1 TRINITY_DN2355_c0_g1~~TRINITY_DN2355_c0_g1_i1.p1  ORF type:complete len:120 (-),score=8.62 TRINITY_DN2355_c0_g1_i1:109-426(-)
MRKLISFGAYIQLISVGFDLKSYLNAKEFSSNNFEINNISVLPLSPSFDYHQIDNFIVIVFGFIIACLLRLSHDAMWQREWAETVMFAAQRIRQKYSKDQIYVRR